MLGLLAWLPAVGPLASLPAVACAAPGARALVETFGDEAAARGVDVDVGSVRVRTVLGVVRAP